MRIPAPDPLRVLDAIYRFDLDETGWLRVLTQIVRPALPGSPGIAACTYDALDGAPRVASFVTVGAFRASDIARVLAPTALTSQVVFWKLGNADLLVLNGLAPGGYGVWIAGVLPDAAGLDDEGSEGWKLLPRHLAQALAIRRQLHSTARPTSESLTGREREVLAFAAAGNTTKLIAFELGIADATVRVLLKRAAKKLGARNRLDAIARFARGPESPLRIM